MFDEVQMEGKRRMAAAEFLRGFQVRSGERLGLLKRAPRGATKTRSVRARPASAGPTASAAEASAKIAPARAAAFEILTQVGENKGHSDELLHSPRMDALTPEDRNLATALVMGVLRWQIALDARVSKLLARPEQRLAEPVALALRMGAFQLLHMDRIPAHAVLQRKRGAVPRRRPSSRRRHGQRHPAQTGRSTKARQRIFESPAAFAERLGHPRWLVERWVAAYGREAALTSASTTSMNPNPGSSSPRPSQRSDRRRWTMAPAWSRNSRPQRFPPPATARRGYGTAAPRRAENADIRPAAPRARNPRHRRQRQTPRSSLQLGCGTIRTRAHPHRSRRCGSRIAPSDATFDLILCDVPCSGTGTLARNPEIRHRLRADDLAAAGGPPACDPRRSRAPARARRPTRLSTCSLEPEENERVVDAAASAAGLRRLSVEPLLAASPTAGILPHGIAGDQLTGSAINNGALRTLPGVHPCDGFFAAVLERN